jgi:hypothetical protein
MEKINWLLDKELSDDASGLVVQIKRQDLSFPKYSINVCVRLPSGAVVPFVQPKFEIENDVTVKLQSFNGATLGRLFDEGMLYIQEEMQKRQFDYLEARRTFEERIAATKDHERTPRTGKTAREANKRRNHAANLLARQEADKARTDASKHSKK